jgi:RHS repeat-associated protein
VNVHGQVVSHTGTPGVTASQEYAYDKAGRLTGVADTSARAVCTRRSYAFDQNSNRTSLTTVAGVTGGDCPTTGGATASSVFDTADRLIGDGHVYDAFGRATQIPGSTLTYHVNDLARSQTAGDHRQTWDLDTAGRYRSWTVETNTTGTWTQTTSKANHYDSDSDSPRWIVENTSTGQVTRNVEGPDGDLAATTTATGGTVLSLSTIHGDTPIQLPLDEPTATTVIDTDEYGNVTTGAPARYAWLGAKQRSTETLTGLTLMGVRLYHPNTGRFLSTDPLPGGNPNTYTYPTDPLNTFDLDGKWGIRGIARHFRRNWRRYATGATFGVCVVASAGGCFFAGAASATLSYVADGKRHGFRSRRALGGFGRSMAWNVAGFGAGGALARVGGHSWRSYARSSSFARSRHGGTSWRVRARHARRARLRPVIRRKHTYRSWRRNTGLFIAFNGFGTL